MPTPHTTASTMLAHGGPFLDEPTPHGAIFLQLGLWVPGSALYHRAKMPKCTYMKSTLMIPGR